MGWDLLNSSELDPEVAGLVLFKFGKMRQVALEVLSYHNAASIEEVELICGEARPTQEENQELASYVTI